MSAYYFSPRDSVKELPNDSKGLTLWAAWKHHKGPLNRFFGGDVHLLALRVWKVPLRPYEKIRVNLNCLSKAPA